MNWKCRLGFHDLEDDKEGGWGRLSRQLEENRKAGGSPVSHAVVTYRCKREGCNQSFSQGVH